MSSSGRGRVTGPLAPYAEGLRENAPGQGYTRGRPRLSIVDSLRLAVQNNSIVSASGGSLIAWEGWGPGEPSADP
jgi:hypothetical protein